MGRPRKTQTNLPPRMYLKGRSYWYAGKQWINLGRDLAEARRRWVELENNQAAPGTMSAVIDRYLRERLPLKAASTQASDRYAAATLKKVFGAMAPAEVTSADIYDFMQARGQKSPVRANRERSLLLDIMRFAVLWRHCAENPVPLVPPFREKPRSRYVTDEEFAAVRAVAPPVVAAMMDLARLTGQRLGDLLTLRRDAVTAEGLVFVPRKTVNSSPTRVCIAWTPALRAAVKALEDLDRPIPSTWLVTSRDGTPMSESGWKTAWHRVMARAGLAERFHFHDLRAKTVTELKAAGRDARELSGHASEAMVQQVYDRRITRKVQPLE